MENDPRQKPGFATEVPRETPAQPSPASAANDRHFSTDHLRHDLGKRAISGGAFMVGAQGARFFLNLAATVILARLLVPADFGLVAMVTAFTAYLGMFKGSGLSIATVQRESITQEQVSNLFWINVAMGGLLALAGMAMAAPVAWFYGDPRLLNIMLVLSFTFLLMGASVQHEALLLRQMRIRTKAIIGAFAMLAGVLTGCLMAYFGFRYWSLVGMQISLAATTLALTWWASGWRPGLPTRNSGVLSLVGFGAHLTASDLIGRVAGSIDSILVGRLFGATLLGLYSRSHALLARPLEQVLGPLDAVLVPLLSRLQSEPERYRRTFFRAYDLLALIAFPFTALCLALAGPLIRVILGPGWEGAVPIFAALSLLALFRLMSIANWLLVSQGRGREYLWNSVVGSLLVIAAVVAGLPWGPLGVAIAFAGATLLLCLPILYYIAGRRGPVRTADLWKCILHYLPCWGAVYAAATLSLRVMADAAPLMQLLVGTLLGLAAGAAVAFALKRPRQSALYAWKTGRSLLGGQESAAV